MSSEFLEKFKTELATAQDLRNLSKQKIHEITKAAIKAKAEYKHVVYHVEKLISKVNNLSFFELLSHFRLSPIID